MKTITPAKLKDKLDKDEIILVDVRDPSEYKSCYIEKSHLIPLSEIDSSKLPSLDKPIVIHCKLGGRSAKACGILLEQNPNLEIYNLEGGITAWINAKYPIKSCSKCSLSLEQQVRIIAGALVFSGTLLGATINQLFYLLPGLVGLGLIFAGITNWCGMAILLSKMPWNK